MLVWFIFWKVFPVLTSPEIRCGGAESRSALEGEERNRRLLSRPDQQLIAYHFTDRVLPRICNLKLYSNLNIRS
jgi:hypothetical protein